METTEPSTAVPLEGSEGASAAQHPEDQASSPETTGPEVYIGLITPLGVATDELVEFLSSELDRYGYQSEVLRLSEELEAKGTPVEQYPELRSIELIRRGDELASKFGPESVTTLGVKQLHAKRSAHWDNPELSTKHVPRKVWIFRSLKRTEEVAFLKKTYGEAFYTLAVHASYDSRLRHLLSQMKTAHPSWDDDDLRDEVQKLIEVDQAEEGTDVGQNVRHAFPMADVILPGEDIEELETNTRRFIRLLFGDNEVPTIHEHAMAIAGTTAALSSSLSRKVGAALVSASGDIIAVGTNEVPKAGGGQYGANDHQGRDKDRGLDYSVTSLNSLIANTLDILSNYGWLSKEKGELADSDLDGLTMSAARLLKDERADVMNLIEFQRPLHAEMSAILSAARRGCPIQGATLYSTTYPCHLCAKELVAAGIQHVFWIEPYPKSRAEAMFGESISDIMLGEGNLRVMFTPFTGVTPKAYTRLFTTEEEYKRKSPSGEVVRPPPRNAFPRVGTLSPNTNVPEREMTALSNVELTDYQFDEITGNSHPSQGGS